MAKRNPKSHENLAKVRNLNTPAVRLNQFEKTLLTLKSKVFFKGNESKFIRDAIINYRPIKKVPFK
jgi:hypothetical protein